MYNFFAISGLVTMGFFTGLFGKLELAHNGQTVYAIVQSAEPTPNEDFEVKDLSEHLQKITGARFVVLSETNAVLPEHAIYVGWTAFARKQGLDLAALGDEEWIIKSYGKNLVLAGGRPRGTLYAVYEFLEQQLGCHWFDEFTETIPVRPDLTLKKINIRGQPAFWDRYIHTAMETVHDGTTNGRYFHVRNKATTWSVYGSPNHCHTFYLYAKEWPTNHPEYLAMDKNGARPFSTTGADPGQICLTHPEVRKLMLAQLKGFIAKDRAAAAKAGCKPPRIYAVDQNDTPTVCQCPECKAFCEREGSPSGPQVDLLNSLADGIKDEYPDVLVETLAYEVTFKPPKTIRPRDNVMIRVAQSHAEWPSKDTGDDGSDLFRPLIHPVNRMSYETIIGWSKITKHLAVWDYWILYSCFEEIPFPYVNVRCLQPNLKLFHDNHAEMMFVECEKSETTSFFALKRWLGLKLMQDPDQDPAPLIKTFMDGFYGPASGKMAEYLNYMEARMAVLPETKMLSGMQLSQRPYLTLEFYKTCQRLLDEAEALCGTNAAALLNVRKERIPVDGGIFAMWEQLEKQLPEGQAMPWDREKILQRYEANRLAQIEARCSKNLLQANKDNLQKEMKIMREKWQMELKAMQEKPMKLKAMQEKPPVLRIPRLTDQTAAGDPAKVDWNKATPISPWRNMNGSEIPERKIKGALAQDGKYLYVALEETIDPAKLISRPDVYSGDDWELFFAVQRGAAPYRQMGVSPAGKRFDYEWAKFATDGGQAAVWTNNAVIKSDTAGGRWQMQIAFPLADLLPGGVATGRPFYINIFRATPSPGEHVCWSPTFGDGFHNLERMAELTLE